MATEQVYNDIGNYIEKHHKLRELLSIAIIALSVVSFLNYPTQFLLCFILVGATLLGYLAVLAHYFMQDPSDNYDWPFANKLIDLILILITVFNNACIIADQENISELLFRIAISLCVLSGFDLVVVYYNYKNGQKPKAAATGANDKAALVSRTSINAKVTVGQDQACPAPGVAIPIGFSTSSSGRPNQADAPTSLADLFSSLAGEGSGACQSVGDGVTVFRVSV
ncbi:MAG: hypothetical protein MHMPM18_002790 [Marteilia pararefringens]